MIKNLNSAAIFIGTYWVKNSDFCIFGKRIKWLITYVELIILSEHKSFHSFSRAINDQKPDFGGYFHRNALSQKFWFLHIRKEEQVIDNICRARNFRRTLIFSTLEGKKHFGSNIVLWLTCVRHATLIFKVSVNEKVWMRQMWWQVRR